MKVATTVSCEKAIWLTLKTLLASRPFGEKALLLLSIAFPFLLLVFYAWGATLPWPAAAYFMWIQLLLLLLVTCLAFPRSKDD
jgi:hypothetical protein